MRSKQGGKWLGEDRLDLEERRHNNHIQTLPGGGELFSFSVGSRVGLQEGPSQPGWGPSSSQMQELAGEGAWGEHDKSGICP